jgi:hypothetical protein
MEDDKPPHRISPELAIFIVTIIFFAGVAFNSINAAVARIVTLENHDREYDQFIAQMKQEIDDIADHFGIPKRKPNSGY